MAKRSSGDRGGVGGGNGSGLDARGEQGENNKIMSWRFHVHTWRQFGANKSDASSECVSGEVPMFGVQTDFYLCRRQIYPLAQIEKWSFFMSICVIS